MKKLVITNNKGGTGKTTLSRLLSERFALDGKRVLVIDLDPQCSLSNRYLNMDIGPRDKKDWIPPEHPDAEMYKEEFPEGRSSSADIFLYGMALPYPTRVDNLALLPGHSSNLLLVERVRENDVKDEVISILREWVLLDETKNDYDICIFDTGPSKGPLTSAAIHCSTHMLIPAEMEQQSVEGLYGMLYLRTHENQSRKEDNIINLVGVLPNKYKSQRSRQQAFLEALKEDRRTKNIMMENVMHDWTAYADDSLDREAGGVSLFDRPPSDKARREFENIFQEINNKVFQ